MVGAVALERMVETARARFDVEAHEEAEETAQDTWDVTLSHGGTLDDRWLGTSWMSIAGDTATLKDLESLVAKIAHDLLAEHPDLSLARRRVLAVQVIVDRARAHGDTPAAGSAYKLYLHLTATTGSDGTLEVADLGRAEGLGPVTTARIREWLAGARVTVTPVLDPDRGDPVDAHDPPAWMREQVVLRDQHCVFPDCQRPARACDLDHIERYDPLARPTRADTSGQPRLPLQTTSPGQDHHRPHQAMDLPPTTRRQLRLDRTPRPTTHRRPRPRHLHALLTPTRVTPVQLRVARVVRC